MKIEPVQARDRRRLLDVAIATGLFEPEDAEMLLGGILTALEDGSLSDGHAAVACIDTGAAVPAGWCYFAPDPHADAVWNLWWIGVAPEAQGSSAGAALLAHAEEEARRHNARILVIETSDAESTARARRFYEKSGYEERGRIPSFYGPREAKVIFSRPL